MLPNALLPFAHKMAGHAAYALGAGTVAALDFQNQVTTGSIIATAVVLALAGLFTIRSKIAKVWRDERDAERTRADRLEGELTEAKRERAEFDHDQQELRHKADTEIARLTSDLKILEAKTDLTAAIDAMKMMNEGTVTTVSAAITEALRAAAVGSRDRDDAIRKLLEEIRDELRGSPAPAAA